MCVSLSQFGPLDVATYPAQPRLVPDAEHVRVGLSGAMQRRAPRDNYPRYQHCSTAKF
jgi:hypothetical protein